MDQPAQLPLPGPGHSGLDTNEGAEEMVLRHDMRNHLGGIMAAPLCIFTPEAGGMNDDEFVPNPVIASMQILDEARGVQKLRAIPETVRLGRQMGFSRSLIVDDADHSRVVAVSEGMGVSLGGTPGHYEKVDNPSIVIEDSKDLPPLHQVFGAVRSPDGVCACPSSAWRWRRRTPRSISGFSTSCSRWRPPRRWPGRAATDRLQIESYHCMFAARGKVGPFRTTAQAFVGSQGRVGARVTLSDEGNGDRVVALASAQLRIV